MDPVQVLDQLRASAIGGGDGEGTLTKAWLTSTGITNYNLERPARTTYPVLTPLRNEIPREVDGNGDVAVHWKTITAINTTQMPIGLGEGQRGGVITTTVQNRIATYVTFGLDDYVTYQAEWAAEKFDDVLMLAVRGLLESTMIAEEQMILGGNGTQTNADTGADISVKLGTTNTPAGTGATTGGALSDGTYYVGCVALTHDGYRLATVTAGVVQQVSRTNADGTTSTINGGTALPSALSTGVTLSAGSAVQKITAHATAIQGAVAYAWFLGSSASHQYLQQITTINSVAFTTALVSAARQDFQTLTATDFSNLGSFSFTGLLYQTGFNSTNSGGYYASLATGTDGVGTGLTSDTAGGVVEIETALQAFWDNYRLSPDTIWVSGKEGKAINKIVIAGGGTPLFRFDVAGDVAQQVVGGSGTKGYFNKFTQTQLEVRVHPYMPPGTIMFSSKRVPYPHPGFGEVAKMNLRRDYFQIQWPIRTLRYEYGVYADGVLQVYFLPAYGVITNIGTT